MLTGKTFHDISVTLGVESIDYPGDPPYSSVVEASISAENAYRLTRLELSAHAGTHLDAPAHFVEGGKTLDQLGVDTFALPARVIDVDDPVAVRPAAFADLAIEPGEAVLFRTRNSTRGLSRSGRFDESYVSIAPDAARALAEKGVALVGLDYITIDPPGTSTFAAHLALLSRDVLILEGIALDAVEAGTYELFCFPIKLAGVEAAPARALLVG